VSEDFFSAKPSADSHESAHWRKTIQLPPMFKEFFPVSKLTATFEKSYRGKTVQLFRVPEDILLFRRHAQTF